MKKSKKDKYIEELSTLECEECGELITKKRLHALPHTKVCINCAEDKEKTGEFVKSHMEITTEVEKGELESVDQILIKGD